MAPKKEYKRQKITIPSGLRAPRTAETDPIRPTAALVSVPVIKPSVTLPVNTPCGDAKVQGTKDVMTLTKLGTQNPDVYTELQLPKHPLLLRFCLPTKGAKTNAELYAGSIPVAGPEQAKQVAQNYIRCMKSHITGDAANKYALGRKHAKACIKKALTTTAVPGPVVDEIRAAEKVTEAKRKKLPKK